MDGVVKELIARMLSRGLSLVNVNDDDREWNLKHLLFADDTGLVTDSEKKLCQMVEGRDGRSSVLSNTYGPSAKWEGAKENWCCD